AGYDSSSLRQQTAGRFRIIQGGTEVVLSGSGQGLVEALIGALQAQYGEPIEVVSFAEHALEAGTDAKALASVVVAVRGVESAACCIDEDSAVAALQAILSAVGRSAA